MHQALETHRVFQRRWARAALLWSMLASLPLHGTAQACDRSPILVRDATLWAPSGPTPRHDVLFVDDRVVSIARGGSLKALDAMRVIDGKGQTLLP